LNLLRIRLACRANVEVFVVVVTSYLITRGNSQTKVQIHEQVEHWYFQHIAAALASYRALTDTTVWSMAIKISANRIGLLLRVNSLQLGKPT